MISEEQKKIMYQGLPLKGRLKADAKELEQIDSQLKGNYSDYFLWCARAVVCGDLEEAVKSYSQALSIRPLSPHTSYNRGRKYLSQNRFPQALADFKLSTLLDPKDGWKWHFQGVALYFLSRYDEAIQAFQEAVKAHRHSGEALLPFEADWICNCCWKSGRLEEVRWCIAQVTADTPVEDSERTYKNRLLLYGGHMTPEEYLAAIDYSDILEAVNQLYGLSNYYFYLKNDTETSREYLNQVLSHKEADLCWGYKMALRDKDSRISKCSREV